MHQHNTPLHGRGGPLAGIRVIDFTQFLSGPFGTQILGDLGAEVIKIEAPSGDLSRTVPPNLVEGDSTYFLSINRNKRSVAIDLKSEIGADLALRLIDACDVVIENNRPGVMERLGLAYATVQARNPRAVYCSISGFGQTGPDRDLPAYDMIVQAMSGGMSMTGEPGRAPVRAGIPIADLNAGMYAVIGILAALQDRQRTGRGSFVDVSMLDVQLAMSSYLGASALFTGLSPGPQGRGHEFIPTYRSFTCADDKDIVITANTQRMWLDMCRAMGLSELGTDPRFATAAQRLSNRSELWSILEPRFREHDSAHWIASLAAVSIPVGPVLDLCSALASPQSAAREMVCEMQSAAGSQVHVPGNPLKMGAGSREPSYPPHLGEHTERTLSEWLGLDEAAVQVLRNQGVVHQFQPGLSIGPGA
jgi:CoA:oxalate CoA-transferase